MILPNGATDIPRGKLAAIATTLERPMDCELGLAAPEPRGTWSFEEIPNPDPDAYLDLWRRVGGPQLWYGRLIQTEAEVAAYLSAETTRIFTLDIDGRSEGIADLDFSVKGACEIVYFGVTPQRVGSGAARFMMAKILNVIASTETNRLWLHTNTIDHQRAMRFYERAGFVPVRQWLEIADDPRLTGLYPRKTAPQVPIFD